MSKVTKFYPKNAASNPDNVLEQAIGEYDSVLTLGYTKDGDMQVRASLNLTQSDINWMIDSLKKDMLEGLYADD